MSFTTFPKTHIGIQTAHLEEAIAFYTHLFGEAPDKTRPGYAKFLLNAPPLNLALTERSEAVPHPGHFGLQVSTVDEVLARKTALEAHYPVRAEMDVRCCYARQDKFWAVDPDGNKWEVFVFHEDVEVNDPPYQRSASEAVAVSADACCVKSA